MDIVYAVDLKIPDNGTRLEDILTMDISCLNILAFSSSYLPKTNHSTYSPYIHSQSFTDADQPLFCVYICALEQPWYFHLITTSHTPFIQLAWSLNGTHLLACNHSGLCQVFQIKNACINTMDKLYQYEINEEILATKYIYPKEIIQVNFNRKESIFYQRINSPSAQLQYALHSGSFLCVTSSGTIHTLPIKSSLFPYSYSLSQNNEPLGAYHCDIYSINHGVNIILSEHTQGALIHFFVVHYDSLETKFSYKSTRTSGFRLPSCYGTLQSLKYFQRYGSDCILTHMRSSNSDIIDIYEYRIEREEWISTSLFNSSQIQIQCVTFPMNSLFINDEHYQGLFGRQILLALNDGSIVCFDNINLQCRQRWFAMEQNDYFLRIQHTHSGSCCVGFTRNGYLLLLRTISLNQISSLPSFVDFLVHLFEQYIVQHPYPCDLWDILCLIPNTSMINELIDRLVMNFDVQSLEFKRTYFTSLKICLYHLHRLARPMSNESCEHLTSLILYHILLIVREYLRLFIYEPTNRNFVDAAQEILQQTSFMENLDVKRIKYLGDHLANNIHYQLISFMRLIDWITNIIFALLSYFQSPISSHGLICGKIVTDVNQLQWLRELIIYCYILQQMKRIPACQITNLFFNGQRDLLKDIYHTLTRFSQRIEIQNVHGFAEDFIKDFPVLALETFQSKMENMFPQFFRFLLPNSPILQTFHRDQSPFDDLSEIQFDIINLGKMSLSSQQTFRRCIRCLNFTRCFNPEPYPFLAYRLNHRCLCAGLFIQFTQ